MKIRKSVHLFGFATVISFCFLSFLFILPGEVFAKSFTYPSYDVEIDVHSDSTVDVTETLTYRFTGEFRGVIRQITLENERLAEFCSTTGATCGGFEHIALVGVFDQSGKELTLGTDYELYIESNEDTGMSYYTIKWEVWPGGKVFSGNETFTWKLKYHVYGSLGWVGTKKSTAVPYLYWNALPETRGGDVEKSNIKINLPEDVEADSKDLEVFSSYSNFQYTYQTLENSVNISAANLGSYGDFTVAYSLPRTSIEEPAKLGFGGILPMLGTRLKIDGIDLGNVGGNLDSFPPGNHKLEFYRDGYDPKQLDIHAAAGEVLSLSVNLNPTLTTLLLIIASLLLNLVGIVLIPMGMFWVYTKWTTKGKDINMPPTIVPQFHPPEGVQPYILGSLKDEKVDREDVTGTIIDLAYRGYIRIKEIKKNKNYQLTRINESEMKPKPNEKGLNGFEQKLLDDLFGTKDQVETKKLGDRFAAKYSRLVKKVYTEMVERGYFSESPESTRLKYFGMGAGWTVVGVLALIFLGIGGLFVIGFPGPLLLGVAGVTTGIAQLITANYMPAKTTEGSKTLAEVKGFQMYLYHAERYRLQGLDPEEFERYLPYAIVFGIEEKWADKFKDIYKGQPDWYESSRSNVVWDAYWMSTFMRGFSTSLNSTVYQSLPKGGGASGSGWSGGMGSFGGFSGGGGGGGISGAF